MEYVLTDEQKAIVKKPFTVKTNEKTRLIKVKKEAVCEITKQFLREEFISKLRYLKEMKCLGQTRFSFSRILPILLRSKRKRVQQNTMILKQGDPLKNVYFIKQGHVSVVRKVRFVKPSFLNKVPSLKYSNEALY